MRKIGKHAWKSLMAFCMAVVMMAATFAVQTPLNAMAATTGTAEGKVESGSDGDMLKLDSSGGHMQIKMDNTTQITGAGILYVGQKVKVTWRYGDDKYLHANTIAAEGGTTWGATINKENVITVSGTVLEGSDASVMNFRLNGSDLKIRLDRTTEYENFRFLTPGKEIILSAVVGSDQYFHATKIRPGSLSATSQLLEIGSATQTSDGKPLANLTGEVLSGTTEALLQLQNSDSKFIIKIDDTVTKKSIRALIPGSTIGVQVYRGDDKYLHAYTLAGKVSTTATGTRDSSAPVQVTGTVQKKTDDNTLYLKATTGDMIIRMDPDTDMTKAGLLVLDKKLDVWVVRGSDSYMHATKIVNAGGVSNSSTNPLGIMSATVTGDGKQYTTKGTVQAKTTNGTLFLKTSGGEDMTIRIDANTQWPNSKALTPNEEVEVTFYRGSDSVMHAASVTSKLAACDNVTLDASTQLEFSGTIDKIDGYTIHVKNDSGTVIYRFDNNTDFTYCRILTTGRKVTVTGMIGSDKYWHAKKVVAES